MKKDFLETEKIRLVQEQLCGFLLDEVIHTGGQFHENGSALEPNKEEDLEFDFDVGEENS